MRIGALTTGWNYFLQIFETLPSSLIDENKKEKKNRVESLDTFQYPDLAVLQKTREPPNIGIFPTNMFTVGAT